MERAFERAGKPFEEPRLIASLHRLARTSLEDALSAVGRGEVRANDVVKAVFPDWTEDASAPQQQRRQPAVTEAGWFALSRAPAASSSRCRARRRCRRRARAIPIRGINGDLPVRFAPEGGAVPGDRIVGILTPGEGITIYPIQSPALKAFDDEPERWLDVRWDIDGGDRQRFPARLKLTSLNEPGSLAQIAQVIGERDGNIDNIRMSRRSPDFTEVTIDIEVHDLKHLNAIIADLRTKSVVSSVERYNG